eukprot:c28860_g2_i2 orf=182-3967(+)
MTVPSEENATSSASAALAQHWYQEALELEKQLRSLIEAKGPFDPHVQILLYGIRESYEAIILEDHEFAEKHDVGQSLWRLHYRRIEEFRARLRKSTSSTTTVVASTAVAAPGNRGSLRNESQNKGLAVFKSFLSEASGFYHDLILKIRAKHGLSSDYLSSEEVVDNDLSRVDKRASDLMHCQLSCHQCFIYLGDLARYKELHSGGVLASHDWSVAAGYYVKAASLWPSGGNPHNQLAVLATYVSDELLAVYRYFRSLATDTPFLTARDNLILLFEKNRQHYLQLTVTDREAISSQGVSRKGINKVKSRGDKILPVEENVVEFAERHDEQQVIIEGEISPVERLKNFRIRFVHLNGILFTQTNVETFPEVFADTLHDIKQLFCSTCEINWSDLSLDHLYMGGTSANAPALLLQLATILIFTVHNISLRPDAHQPTYAEILQRSSLLQHAFTAAFEYMGCLIQKCIDAKDVSVSPLLPAILIFMEWLACRPEMSMGTKVFKDETNARLPFWRKCVDFLNRCLDDEVMEGLKEGSKGDIGLASANTFRKDRGGEFALWEDHELCGFTPLAPAQLVLDYSKRPIMGLGNKRDREIRVQRLIAAGKAVASFLGKSVTGIIYDEEIQRFYVAGDRERKDIKKEYPGTLVENSQAVDRLELLTEPVLSTDVTNGHLQSGKPVMVAEKVPMSNILSGEDEDEVIVFKPLMKEQPSYLTPQFVQAHDAEGLKNSHISCPTFVNISENTNPFNSVNHRPLQMLSSHPAGKDKSNCGPTALLSTLKTSASPSGQKDMIPVSDASQQVSSIIMGPAESAYSSLVQGPFCFNGRGSSVLDSPFTMLNQNGKTDSSLGTDFNVAYSGGGWPSSIADGLAAGIDCGPFPNWGIGNGYDSFNYREQYSPFLVNSRDNPGSKFSWNTDLQTLAAYGVPGLRLGDSNLILENKIDTLNSIPNPPSMIPLENSQQNTLGTVSHSLTTGGSPVMCCEVDESLQMLFNKVKDDRNSVQVFKVSKNHGAPAHGNAPEKLESDLKDETNPSLKSTVSLHYAKQKSSARPTSQNPSMRPPPGFGSLPARHPFTVSSGQENSRTTLDAGQTDMMTAEQASLSLHKSTQNRGQSIAEGGAPQQADNYCWSDDYTPIRKELNKFENIENTTLVSSSDYGIWSSASSLTNDVTALPFPGMRLSDRYALQQHQQSLISQLELHALQQHQLQGQHQFLQECQMLEQYQQLYGIQLNRDAQQEQEHQQLLLHQQQKLPLWYWLQNARDPFIS